MKHKKRWGLLLAAFLFVGVMTAVQTPKAQAVAMNKNNWYKKVVTHQANTTFKKGSKTYYLNDYISYAAVDINQDGTKELLLGTGENGSLYDDKTVLVLRYYKGKPTVLKEVKWFAGGYVNRYKKSAKRLCVWTRGSAMGRTDVYKIGTTSLNRTLRLTNMRHDMTWKKTINGKACSEKKFNKYWKKYYTNTTKITYHAIWSC